MIAEITYPLSWSKNTLIVKALHRSAIPACIGMAKGEILHDKTGFLGDIYVEEEFEIRSWFLTLGKKEIQSRNRGIGSTLLECFENEMSGRGITQIKGNLKSEQPDTLNQLIQWYQKRGYNFTP